MNITGSDLNAFRLDHSLSQCAVSRETGVSNKDISLFETGKAILSDVKRTALYDFVRKYKGELSDSYQDENQDLGENEDQLKVEAPVKVEVLKKGESRHLDGFVIPPNVDMNIIEQVIKGYHDREQKIANVLDQMAPRKLFGDVDFEVVMRDLMIPIMQNYCTIRAIQQGQRVFPTLKPASGKVDKDKGVTTYRDVIRHLIAAPLNRGCF